MPIIKSFYAKLSLIFLVLILALGVGSTSLSLRAKVVWSTEATETKTSSVMGVQFEDLEPEGRAALLRFLAEELQRFRL